MSLGTRRADNLQVLEQSTGAAADAFTVKPTTQETRSSAGDEPGEHGVHSDEFEFLEYVPDGQGLHGAPPEGPW